MQTIRVTTGRPYDVVVGTRLLEQAGARIRAVCGGDAAVIVTDSNVGPLYARIVEESLAGSGYRVRAIEFPAGEEHKRAETYLAILDAMAEAELDRSSVVVALGGGVTGDVAGFAAATYMRGIDLVQMPTSLLSMVDSSVGGKTAIDLARGKNLVGAFWQPRLVLADVGCLGTLSPEQFADGCGEVVKHAVLADENLFEILEHQPLTYEVLLRDLTYVETLVARNIEIKRDVVSQDEREGGVRKLLNLGHSIGHAIEAAEGYRLGHGTCVAMGLTAIARAAATRDLCGKDVPARIEDLLRRHGLKTRTHRDPDELFAVALHDKKRRGDSIDLVIPRRIGACSLAQTDLETFREIIRDGVDDILEVRP